MKNMSPTSLWIEWFRCVRMLRSACSRSATFKWMSLALAGFSSRADLLGVTSFVRTLFLDERTYPCLLNLFHTPALKLGKLTALWVDMTLKLFEPVTHEGRIVFLADGIKVSKEGRKMPAVKKLHQESGNNSKPEFIFGHSFQAISLLAQGGDGKPIGVPLVSRIHEGVTFSNRDKRTLLDKLTDLFLGTAAISEAPAILVADAYYANRKVMLPLVEAGHHLVTRARKNTVAWRTPTSPAKPKRGRPKLYGDKVKLRDLFNDKEAFVAAPSPVYGEQGVSLSYRCVNLLWRPIGALVRFVLVDHPTRGQIILMCTDIHMEPLSILKLYGYRFKIEVGFKQALRTLGAYGYHFWMSSMKRLPRNKTGNQYVHMETDEYRQSVRRKLDAYHRFVQLGCIAQGLQQHLAVNFRSTIWTNFRSWMRTMKPAAPPSEAVVAHTLRGALEEFLLDAPDDHQLAIFLREHLDRERCPITLHAA